MERYLQFNPAYTLKADQGRVIVLATLVGRDTVLPQGVKSNFETIIHPFYAQILSFMNGEDIHISSQKAADFLRVDPSMILAFVNKISNKEKFLSVKTAEGVSAFPPCCLIETDKPSVNNRFAPESFSFSSVDLSSRRYSTPSSLTLMVNNKCYTNCFYCYADRRKKTDCQIPLDKMKDLIKQAVELDVKVIDVIGGEFFMYKYWYELLQELHKNQFYPYLSTKMPLDEACIQRLKELKIKDLQISLDTLIPDHL